MFAGFEKQYLATLKQFYKLEFESKVILFGKLYCEFRKRIFFDRKWF